MTSATSMPVTTVELLSLTATEAATLLNDGKLSSIALVDAYLAHIEDHNHAGLCLNAIMSVAPRPQLMDLAAQLDAERSAGQARSPFHGVPIIVKDVFATHADLGVPSTAGGPCFRTAKPKQTAPIIQSLLDHGLILLGKANLTEFCGMKMKGLTPGFSPMGGQTQSPYIYGGLDPEDKCVIGHSSAAGSSSGSASGVAAGFAPWSLGTEACGSLITPAGRAGLYTLKCGPGTVDDRGVFGYTNVFDCIGSMAKSAKDLRWLTAILMGLEETDLKGLEGMDGLRVAATDIKLWSLPDTVCVSTPSTEEQMHAGYNSAIGQIKALGAEVTKDIDLAVPWETFKNEKDESYIYNIAMYQFKNIHLPRWLDGFAHSEVYSLEDIIKYNDDHADLCLPARYPSQQEYIDLLDNQKTAEECDAMIKDMRKKAHEALDPVFKNHDLIVALTDSAICIYASAAGYPVAAVPLGLVKYDERNSRPYSLAIVAEKGREALLLRFMEAFEEAFPARPLPAPLLHS